MKKLLSWSICWIILCSLCRAMPVFGQEEDKIEGGADSCTETVIELATGIEAVRQIEYPDVQKKPDTDSLAAAKLHADSVICPKPSVLPQPEVKPSGNRWGIELNPSEIDLLARIVMLEAGGEGTYGQQAVTEVIFNRMVNSYYGGRLEHVLGAKGQFSTWKSRYSSRALPSAQVLASIHSVINGETNILPFNTLYFSRKAQNRRVQTRIGRHVFCNQ